MILSGGGLIGWWGYDRYQQLDGYYSRLQWQLNDLQRKLEGETSAHQEITARLTESQRSLDLQRGEVARLTTTTQELDTLLRDFKLVTLTDLRVRLQTFEEAKKGNPNLGNLERLRQVDLVADRCSKEIQQLMDKLRDAKQNLDGYRNRKLPSAASGGSATSPMRLENQKSSPTPP
jgi:DNA repair exonuclease SbcCD ATPase subunit